MKAFRSQLGLALFLAATAAGSAALTIPQTPELGTISAGPTYTLAVKADGTVWGWGNNSFGQLGDGTTTLRFAPVEVKGLADVAAVAAGRVHSLALKRDGTVWAWGSNSTGELGDGTTIGRQRPVQVANLDHVVAIAAGGQNYSLALRDDGTVWSWGNNVSGQLGDNTRTPRLRPVRVLKLEHIRAITAGNAHALALASNGEVWAWGANALGQMGAGGNQVDQLQPILVAGLSDVVAVSAGTLSHSLALKRDGTVWGWGNNVSGQLSSEPLIARLTAFRLPGLEHITSIVAGSGHNLAQADDRRVWAWGSNLSGQLGLTVPVDHVKPTVVPDWPAGVVALAAAGNRTVALLSDGSVISTGNNEQGQWGDSTYVNTETPNLGLTATVEEPAQFPALGVWHAARDFSTLAAPE